MSVEQLVALAGVAALVITAIAGLTKAIGDLIGSFRRPDKAPAPEVGIPVPVDHDEDDIDYRAYLDVKERLAEAESDLRKMTTDRDRWMFRALGVDEDTHPS